MGSSLRMMRVIDSHTAGQPTRVVVEGGPDLGTGTIAEQRDRLHAQFDRFRSAVVSEPRGSDTLVGALLTKPSDDSCDAGVIFFDNRGYLDMSGHATIGLTVSLEYLGRIGTGAHKIETTHGTVTADIHPIGDISIQTVPSFRHAKDVTVTVDGAQFTGDIAWAGSWYFLANDHREELDPRNVDRLTQVARSIRRALEREKITGPRDEDITDVALFGPPQRRDANSKDFVLRRGATYRRCPSGTAMAAKLACLYDDGAIAEGQMWRQESIVGTIFDGSVKVVDGKVLPIIRSTAHITAESMLIVDERDPFCWGLS